MAVVAQPSGLLVSTRRARQASDYRSHSQDVALVARLDDYGVGFAVEADTAQEVGIRDGEDGPQSLLALGVGDEAEDIGEILMDSPDRDAFVRWQNRHRAHCQRRPRSFAMSI